MLLWPVSRKQADRLYRFTRHSPACITKPNNKMCYLKSSIDHGRQLSCKRLRYKTLFDLKENSLTSWSPFGAILDFSFKKLSRYDWLLVLDFPAFLDCRPAAPSSMWSCLFVCFFVERAVSFSFSLCLNFSVEFEWQEKLEFLVIWCCSCRRAGCKNLSAKFKHILIFVTSVFSWSGWSSFFLFHFFRLFSNSSQDREEVSFRWMIGQVRVSPMQTNLKTNYYHVGKCWHLFGLFVCFYSGNDI